MSNHYSTEAGRHIFLEPDEDALHDENFDTTQLVLSLGFPF